MFNWLRKKLGYHVCEEFTRWELVEQHWVKLPSPLLPADIFKPVEYIKLIQQRECTICGRVYRRKL